MARVFRMKKGVMTASRLINDRLKAASVRWVPVMVTLTYADADAWRPNHITQFINRVQMYAKRRGYTFPNVWVMELQKRGAPHYHVLFWIPARFRIPRADRQGWWSFGSTNTVRVRNAVGYVAKYASKFESKDSAFPHGARIHGIGGIGELEKRIIAWWKLPKALRTGEEGSCAWRRAVGGGWVNVDTGALIESEWGISAVADKMVRLVKKPQQQFKDYAEIVQQRIEAWKDRQWREMLNLSERLADQRETDPGAYWRVFEEAAQEVPSAEANPEGSFRSNQLMKDRYELLRLSARYAAAAQSL